MKTVIVIQARLGSSRLPCKTLLCLRGLPIIDWVVRRCMRSELADALIVAIPETRQNDVLANHLKAGGIPIWRGPEQDVLARMLGAARSLHAETVIRVCADNPFVWGGEIDNLIRFYQSHPCDYAYNHIPLNNHYPDGFGAEILSFDLFDQIDRKAKLPSQHEHCLTWLTSQPEKFRIATFDPPEKALWHPELKLDIDTAEDFIKLATPNVHPENTPLEIVRLFV